MAKRRSSKRGRDDDGGKRFKYKKRGKDSVKRRATMQTGNYDSYLAPDLPRYKVTEGDHQIRILPPVGWDEETHGEPDHYGLDIWVNYGVGADEQSYLSLSRMKGEADPIEEELRQAQREGDEKYADELKPTRRVLVWIIDRDDESTGPQLWAMPQNLDKDIAKACVDKRTGEVLEDIDDPEEGFDVYFSVEGSGQRRKYTGVQVGGNRGRSTPLSDDEEQAEEWLEFVSEHPLPDTLVFYEYDHIANVLEGGTRADDDDDDDDEEEESPRRNKRSKTRSSKKRSTKRGRDEEDDDDDDDDDEDEDDDDDKKSRRGKRGGSKRRGRQEDDDDDEDEDEEIDDEDEELDDDDEDEEDEDDPRRGKRSKSSRKRRARDDDDEDDEDEEDDDDDEEDDDEEEEDEDDPPKRSSRKGRPSRGKRDVRDKVSGRSSKKSGRRRRR